MALPVEFRYDNEADFIKRFLIPLLQRMGFSVFNYHGTREHGRDLIFAEVDRFGHVKYHGLQAKYEDSIGVNNMRGLIEDSKQAFENPFVHPQRGTRERICSFYAVNGGSISDPAIDAYFNGADKLLQSNVHLLQGRDLITLDRWASVNLINSVGSTVAGMRLELKYNQARAIGVKKIIEEGDRPVERFRVEACGNYLCNPALPSLILPEEVIQYWHTCSACNTSLNSFDATMVMPEKRTHLKNLILNTMLPGIEKGRQTIEASIEKAITSLGPILVM